MEDIEYHPIGEVFEYQGQKIKAKRTIFGCADCVFKKREYFECRQKSNCERGSRKDNLHIIYVPAEEKTIKNKDMEKEEHAYIVKQEDLKGDIKDFPIEIVQKMVDELVKQGNEADVTVFQENRIRPRNIGGFDWGKTKENYDFWCRTIYRKEFNVFFGKYPEGKEKYTFEEEDHILNEENETHKEEAEKENNITTILDNSEQKGTKEETPKQDGLVEFVRTITKMVETYKKKNSDYGDSFNKSMGEFGIIAPVIRMSDKMNRLKSLVKNKQQVNDESIDDTLLDLANYAVMTLAYRNSKMDK